MSGDDRQNSPSISRQNRPSATARGNADAIRIYDVSEAKQLKALDLSTTAFAAFEPECCCFYQGKLALSLQNRDIWIFDYIKGLD